MRHGNLGKRSNVKIGEDLLGKFLPETVKTIARPPMDDSHFLICGLPLSVLVTFPYAMAAKSNDT